MSDIDWQNPFRPEDFYKIYEPAFTGECPNCSEMSEIANRRFREMIETCPIVFAMGIDRHVWVTGEGNPITETSLEKARIICIEEIGK